MAGYGDARCGPALEGGVGGRGPYMSVCRAMFC